MFQGALFPFLSMETLVLSFSSTRLLQCCAISFWTVLGGVCASACVCAPVHVEIHLCIHTWIYPHICMHVHTCVWEFVCTSECLWARTHSHTIAVAWSLSGDMALGGPASWNPETWKTNQRLKLILH